MTYDLIFFLDGVKLMAGKVPTENVAAARRFLDIQAKPQGGANCPLSTVRGLRQELNTISIKPDESKAGDLKFDVQSLEFFKQK